MFFLRMMHSQIVSSTTQIGPTTGFRSS